MDELSLRIVDYDIVGITESWGTDDIFDAELNLPGFQLFRVDRNTRGGGVLLYVSEGIEAVRMENVSTFGFNGYSLRGHHMKLKVHRSRLQLRQCFFSQRVVSL